MQKPLEDFDEAADGVATVISHLSHHDQLRILGMAAGFWLSQVQPHKRQDARDQLVALIDETIKDAVLKRCDA